MNAPRLASLIIVLFAASVGEQLFGQEQPDIANLAAQDTLVAPGARVRVSMPNRVVGTVVSLKPDTLVILQDQGDQLVVLIASLTKLEVSRGQKSKRGKGALIGAGTGAALGLVVTLAACGDGSCDEYAAAVGVVLGAGGALAGALIGALVGSTSKTDHWEAVPLDQLRVGLTPRRGRLEVSAKFVF